MRVSVWSEGMPDLPSRAAQVAARPAPKRIQRPTPRVGLVLATAVSTWQAVRATLAERRALAGFRMARDAVDRSFTQVSVSVQLWMGPCDDEGYGPPSISLRLSTVIVGILSGISLFSGKMYG